MTAVLKSSQKITPLLQRTKGVGRLSLKTRKGATVLQDLFQQGSAKIHLPASYGHLKEAVLVNTAGGLTDGDHLGWTVKSGAGTNSVITTQACEKIYQSTGAPAHVTTAIEVDEGASLFWLPQETILFNQSNLRRTLDVDVAKDARFIALEAVMLGREAMGETIKICSLHDRWRIRREGKLVHADDIRIGGNVADVKDQRALLNGNAAFASVLYCGPEETDVLENFVRTARENAQNLGIGISTMNGKITTRFLAENAYALRATLIPFLQHMLKWQTPHHEESGLPKVWNL